MQEFGTLFIVPKKREAKMSDPYKVLGVSKDATDDEIKRAYRELSRKYHPDANVNNPNKDKAEEMFKLVQQAYNQIMNEKKNGAYEDNPFGSGRYQDFGGFGGFGNFGSFGGFGDFNQSRSNSSYSETDSYYQAAANYINNRHFEEALNVLSNIADRSAKWYYYSAIANNGVGNNIIALDHAKTAASMEPDNMTYRRLLNTLESGEQWYTDRQYEFGGSPSSMCCSNPCLTLCLLNACCCRC